ncbi:MAG: hypothetical protein IKF82_06260 [Bacilli bacterium]|nr:hypothetical protein [Bacilli bacterium]MBR3209852.1 hypothetical protein [Bacilli bacterium]
MLEKERFLALKKLAKDIREDSKSFFKKLEKEPLDKVVTKKNEFVESVLKNMSIAFSDGEEGKEETQILRANILIPDDEEFFETYSKNKNIRSLMNKYAVNIEDIMSKITELNIYGKFLEEDSNDFVDEMVKITPKEAEDLLDEIDDLSNTLTNLDLSSEIKKAKKDKEETSFIKDEYKEIIDREKNYYETKKNYEPDNILDESFDSINRAISGFITDYNVIKEESQTKDHEINRLKEKIEKGKNENEQLISENKKLSDRQSEYRKENNDLKSEKDKLLSEIRTLEKENDNLTRRMKLLEDKLIKTATLLNKVYNGIHRD